MIVDTSDRLDFATRFLHKCLRIGGNWLHSVNCRRRWA
mgnify:CR=1 FL=1